jgi:hypothetical protein
VCLQLQRSNRSSHLQPAVDDLALSTPCRGISELLLYALPDLQACNISLLPAVLGPVSLILFAHCCHVAPDAGSQCTKLPRTVDAPQQQQQLLPKAAGEADTAAADADTKPQHQTDQAIVRVITNPSTAADGDGVDAMA